MCAQLCFRATALLRNIVAAPELLAVAETGVATSKGGRGGGGSPGLHKPLGVRKAGDTAPDGSTYLAGARATPLATF